MTNTEQTLREDGLTLSEFQAKHRLCITEEMKADLLDMVVRYIFRAMDMPTGAATLALPSAPSPETLTDRLCLKYMGVLQEIAAIIDPAFTDGDALPYPVQEMPARLRAALPSPDVQAAADALADWVKRTGDCNCYADVICEGCQLLTAYRAACSRQKTGGAA